MSKKITAINIVGRRWFRKSAGNTYSSALVYVDNEDPIEVAPECAYGEHYVEMAFEALVACGIITDRERHPHGKEQLWQWCDRHGVIYTHTAIDVARERDL